MGLVAPDVAGEWLVVETGHFMTFDQPGRLGMGGDGQGGHCGLVDMTSVRGEVGWCGSTWRE